MEQHTGVFVGVDAAKKRHAVAMAEEGRQGEVRYLGEMGADAESVCRLVAKLEKRHGPQLHFCYENGPTGYGLHRQTRRRELARAARRWARDGDHLVVSVKLGQAAPCPLDPTIGSALPQRSPRCQATPGTGPSAFSVQPGCAEGRG